MHRVEKIYAGLLTAVLLAVTLLAALTTPLHYEDGFKNVMAAKKKAAVVTTTIEQYGPDPYQLVTLRRDVTVATPGKTVIFLHGGGWNAGGRGSLEAEAAEWAKTGWVSINVQYRRGVSDGIPDDGKYILADVLDVLETYRLRPYVDPNKIVVYGESAGGHLAEWLGTKYGAKVKAFVGISPVSSIQGAITAGEAEGAPDNVRNLGGRAQEFFGYSVGTTDSHRYFDRAQHAFFAISTNEWVDPDVHARISCAALGDRCHLQEYAGTAHGGALIDQHPEIAVDARHWAGVQINP